MAIKTILYDLDGTLLPMDQDEFMKVYFGLLAKKAAGLFEPKALVDGVWAGTAAMVKNDGSRLNCDAFWDTFCSIFGEDARKSEPVFDDFYRNEFEGVGAVCPKNPLVPGLIKDLKARGIRQVIATNPFFPVPAVMKRMNWAGIEAEDFELVTTYDNSHFCKPNPKYFEEILSKLQLDPSECLMVGNDADEDTAALKAGVRVFLITDCLINKHDRDLSDLPHGSFEDLREFLKKENIL